MARDQIRSLLEEALSWRSDRDKSRDAQYPSLPGGEERIPRGYYLVDDLVTWDDEVMPRDHPVRLTMGEGPFKVRTYTERVGVYQDTFTDFPQDQDPDVGLQMVMANAQMNDGYPSTFFMRLEKPVPVQADLLVTNERDALRAPAYCFLHWRQPIQWIGPTEEGQELFGTSVLDKMKDRGVIG